jgi:hypothetical protein
VYNTVVTPATVAEYVIDVPVCFIVSIAVVSAADANEAPTVAAAVLVPLFSYTSTAFCTSVVFQNITNPYVFVVGVPPDVGHIHNWRLLFTVTSPIGTVKFTV